MKGLQYLISLQDRVSNVANKIKGNVSTLIERMGNLTDVPNTVSIQDNVSSTANQISNNVNGLSNQIEELATGNNSVTIQDNVSRPAQQITNQANALSNRLQELSTPTRVTIQDNLTTVANQVTNRVNTLVTRLRTIPGQIRVSIQDGLTTVAGQITNRVNTLVTRLRTIPGQIRVSIQDTVSATADRIKTKVSDLIARLRGLGSQSRNTGNDVDGLSGSFSRFMKITGLAAGLTIAQTIGAIGQQVANVGQQFVDASLKAQGAERVIRFASGAEGAKNLEFLYSTIDRLNLPLVATRDAFASVTGAFKDTVLAGQPMRDIFEGVSTATSTLNLTGETTSGVFLALSQIMSKGKLMAEELTGQLGERLPGALGIAARSMGVSTGKLMEMMQKGEVLAVDFLPKFAAELKKTFGEEAVKAAQSPQAQLTRLSNRFEELKIKIGNQVLPIVLRIGVALMQVLERVVPMVDKVSKFIGASFGQAYSTISPIIKTLSTNLQQVIVPIQNYFRGMLTLWNMLSSIFSEVAGMVAGAVDWGGLLSRIFTIATNVISGVVTILKVVWNVLSPIVGLVIKLVGWIVNGLGNVALAVLEGVSFAFVKIADGVEWVYNKIVEFLEFVGLISKKPVVVTVQQKVDNVANKLSTIGSIPQNLGSTTNGGAPSDSKSTTDKINQGGSRPINISIKYDAMIKDGITINTTNLKEGAKDIEKIIIETLLRTLNGATQIAPQ